MIQTFATFGQGVENYPFKSFGLLEKGFELIGNTEAAKSCEAASGMMCALTTISGIAALPKSVKKVVEVSKKKDAWPVFKAVSSLAGKVIGTLVSFGYAIQMPGLKFFLTKTLTPIIPFGELFLYGSGVVKAGALLYSGPKLKLQEDSDVAAKKSNVEVLKNREKISSGVQHVILLALTIISIVGVSLSAGVLFATSLTTFALAMFTFIAKKSREDIVSTAGKTALGFKEV